MVQSEKGVCLRKTGGVIWFGVLSNLHSGYHSENTESNGREYLQPIFNFFSVTGEVV